MKKLASVEEYIENAPEESRGKLRQMRAAIREVAPHAEEKMSYGMPYYSYKGRLAYFGFAKKHVGLYIPTPTLEEHGKDLEGYDYEPKGATLRLPLDKELPVGLIKKLVRARVKTNEEKKR